MRTTVWAQMALICQQSLAYSTWRRCRWMLLTIYYSGRWNPTGWIRGKMGNGLSIHRAILAAQLGAHHPVLQLPTRNQKDHLHHQCHWVGKYVTAQGYQEPGIIPQWWSSAEIVLSGADEHQPEMDHASAKLESRSQQVYHYVRGAHAYPLTHNRLHKIRDTPGVLWQDWAILLYV